MNWMILPLKRYAEFSGRSRRTEFWMFFLFQILLNIALNVLALVMFGGSVAMLATSRDPAAMGAGAAAMGGGFLLIGLLYLVLGLGFLIPNIAVAVRRLHDTDRSGWWVLAPLLGYVVLLVGFGAGSRLLALLGFLVVGGLGLTVFVFYLVDGTPGANRYGSDPKNRVDPRVFA